MENLCRLLTYLFKYLKKTKQKEIKHAQLTII